MEGFEQVPDWLKDIQLQLFAEGKPGETGKGDADDSDKDDTSKDKDDAGKKDGDADQDGGDGGDDEKKSGEKIFTQDDLNKVLKDRLKRERKAWEQKIEDEKKKAAMTESDRLKAEKDESEKKASGTIERTNQRLIRSEVMAQAAALKIIDPDAAFALMEKTGIEVEDDDSVTGVKSALETLVKAKPYLVGSKDPTKKTGDDQGDDKSKKSGFSMNDLIRKAAGRNQ